MTLKMRLNTFPCSLAMCKILLSQGKSSTDTVKTTWWKHGSIIDTISRNNLLHGLVSLLLPSPEPLSISWGELSQKGQLSNRSKITSQQDTVVCMDPKENWMMASSSGKGDHSDSRLWLVSPATAQMWQLKKDEAIFHATCKPRAAISH